MAVEYPGILSYMGRWGLVDIENGHIGAACQERFQNASTEVVDASAAGDNTNMISDLHGHFPLKRT
jgi:hypothetical protein